MMTFSTAPGSTPARATVARRRSPQSRRAERREGRRGTSRRGCGWPNTTPRRPDVTTWSATRCGPFAESIARRAWHNVCRGSPQRKSSWAETLVMETRRHERPGHRGGAGYIGSVIVEALLRRGHTVTVLDSLYKGHRAAWSPRRRAWCRSTWWTRGRWGSGGRARRRERAGGGDPHGGGQPGREVHAAPDQVPSRKT